MFCLFNDCECCCLLFVGANNFDLGDPDNLPLAFIETSVCRDKGRLSFVDYARELSASKSYCVVAAVARLL